MPIKEVQRVLCVQASIEDVCMPIREVSSFQRMLKCTENHVCSTLAMDNTASIWLRNMHTYILGHLRTPLCTFHSVKREHLSANIGTLFGAPTPLRVNCSRDTSLPYHVCMYV